VEPNGWTKKEAAFEFPELVSMISQFNNDSNSLNHFLQRGITSPDSRKSSWESPERSFLFRDQSNSNNKYDSAAPVYQSPSFYFSPYNHKSAEINQLSQGKKNSHPADLYRSEMLKVNTSGATYESDVYERPLPSEGLGHYAYFTGGQSGVLSATKKKSFSPSVKLDDRSLISKQKKNVSQERNTRSGKNSPGESEMPFKSPGKYLDIDLRQSFINSKNRVATMNSLQYAVRTRAGNNYTGARKTNQDNYIIHSNFGKNPNKHLFAVCDGHGEDGHFVSGLVKESLPIYLLSDPHFENKPELAFANSFELCHQKLMQCDFDSQYSGSTCVSVLIDGDRVISGNAGDSRAVMGAYNQIWSCTPLSNDHKPELFAESRRIIAAGGRIEKSKDSTGKFAGPNRVWLRHENAPGLAMSRSIGDMVAASVGVTCSPEVKEFQISADDKFMIIASDGVWEFIESMEAVMMIAPFYQQNDLNGACDLLLNTAVQRWQEEGNTVDDVTLIIIFF
jgi:serine/threonine protein phosphatase PrpC